MKYYLLAGEASGDLHGAYLMNAILQTDPSAIFRFWGGDKMAEIGGSPVVHYRERSIMGFAKVLANLPKIMGFLKRAKQDIAAWQPDRVIFIDNSGFNLPVAKWAKEEGFNTHYYISPQVWASREGRVKSIKACIDQMYVVLPFVKDFYAKHDYEVAFVGHPLLDVIDDYLKKDSLSKGSGIAAFQDITELTNKENTGGVKVNPAIALLPGSRTQEIKSMLPTMLAAAKQHPQYSYIIAQAPSQPLSLYQEIVQSTECPPDLRLVKDATYPLFAQAHAALVTSGTATLEAGLFGVPQVVCYKGSWLEYQIARRLVKVDYISLVNLAMGKEVVPELIQQDLTAKNLATAFTNILSGPGREQQIKDLQALKDVLGTKGAPQRAAKMICQSS